MFSLSEIGCSASAVFSKVRGQVAFYVLGLFPKPGWWASPLTFSRWGKKSVDPGDPPLRHPYYVLSCALIAPRPCCFCTRRTALLVRSSSWTPQGPRYMSYTLTCFCFFLPGISFTHFAVCHSPKGSENWRNQGCVSAVVENLRQCSRSNLQTSGAWGS